MLSQDETFRLFGEFDPADERIATLRGLMNEHGIFGIERRQQS
jgi:hypothetical protein